MIQDYQFKATITGLTEDIETFIEKVNKVSVNTITWNDYSNFFDFTDATIDWGTEWISFEDKKYVQGEFFSITGYFDSSPAEGFWKKISSDYKLSVQVQYKTPEFNDTQIFIFGPEDSPSEEKLNFLEFMYFYQNQIFWERITEGAKMYTYDEIMESIGSLFVEFTEDEKNRLLSLYKLKY